MMLMVPHPDRVPFDLWNTAVTGIHIDAYASLREALGMEPKGAAVLDLRQQNARVHEDVLERLKVDTRGILPNPPDSWKMELFQEEWYDCFVNEWSTTWRKQRFGGDVQVVRLDDDLGGQRGTRISPALYRRLVKLRPRRLISHIKTAAKGRI